MALTTITTAASSFTSSAQSRSAIPDTPYTTPWNPPDWFIGLVISWFAFGFVIAIVLLLAQFPQRFPWCKKIAGQPTPPPRARGRTERTTESRTRATSSAFERRGGGGGGEIHGVHGTEGDGFRMRKPRGLSVDTTGKKKEVASGLGILMPAEDDDKLEKGVRKVKKRISFEATVTHARAKTSGHSSFATAPLPQKKSFVNSPLSREAGFSDDSDCDDEEPDLKCPDVETGHPRLNARDLRDRYEERRVSPYFPNSTTNGNDENAAMPGGNDGSKQDSWLEKMNDGAAKMVDRMAMAFYDRVEGAEEGLLLPVKEDEREGWMGRSVD